MERAFSYFSSGDTHFFFSLMPKYQNVKKATIDSDMHLNFSQKRTFGNITLILPYMVTKMYRILGQTLNFDMLPCRPV